MKQSTTISYRVGVYRDVPHIIELVKSVHGDVSDIQPSAFILACEGSRVVGSVRFKVLSDGTAKLASLAVHPEYRQYGIGSEMVKRVLSANLQRPVYILCFPEREMFYARNGFIKISRAELPPLLQEAYDHDVRKEREAGKEVLCMVLRQ